MLLGSVHSELLGSREAEILDSNNCEEPCRFRGGQGDELGGHLGPELGDVRFVVSSLVVRLHMQKDQNGTVLPKRLDRSRRMFCHIVSAVDRRMDGDLGPLRDRRARPVAVKCEALRVGIREARAQQCQRGIGLRVSGLRQVDDTELHFRGLIVRQLLFDGRMDGLGAGRLFHHFCDERELPGRRVLEKGFLFTLGKRREKWHFGLANPSCDRGCGASALVAFFHSAVDEVYNRRHALDFIALGELLLFGDINFRQHCCELLVLHLFSRLLVFRFQGFAVPTPRRVKFN
mmetsp:Transcript_93233/g.268470  ORF Transcript_93233/g.268470 Transcript_93233/m.268470 type:complete len:289 (-) Transcript_93233:230-1096(-)